MLKNVYFRLGLISAIATLSVLAALPRIPIVFNKFGVNVDSYIGGYNVYLFGGRLNLNLAELRKGLDLEGGIRVVLKADMSDIPSSDRDAALDSAKQIIARRVNFLGVTEPNINSVKAGDEYRIVVEIPGIDDITQAVELIGQTAQLKFKELAEGKEWAEEKFPEYYSDPTAWIDTDLTGADLRGADVVFQNGSVVGQNVSGNAVSIQLKMTSEGRRKFGEIAKRNVNKPIAIYLDEDATPLSMPVVSEDLADGVVQDPLINGNFNVDGANALSLQLRAGALPVPVEILEQKTIGATLGEESVHKSLYAGAVGLFLVMVYMIFAYGKYGILADVALLIYTAIVITIFKLVPVVLTLPGVAGFILSIGVAVDANILIFSRIKEEKIWGTPPNLAVRHGFERAWDSIRDSNASSLITAGILFYFGSGVIRGFALTLAIGVLVSLFTSIFVTRTFIEVFNVGGKK